MICVSKCVTQCSEWYIRGLGRFIQEACEANATASVTNNICGLAILANQRSLIIVTNGTFVGKWFALANASPSVANGTFVGWDDLAKCTIEKLENNLKRTTINHWLMK